MLELIAFLGALALVALTVFERRAPLRGRSSADATAAAIAAGRCVAALAIGLHGFSIGDVALMALGTGFAGDALWRMHRAWTDARHTEFDVHP